MAREREAIDDWKLLAQFCQVYRSTLETFMEQIGIHQAQAMLLCRLFVQDGLTQSDIADQLCVQGATVTQMLQRMEGAGFVVRRRDSEDHRLVRVYLTKQGRDKERAIVRQLINLQEALFAGLSEVELVLFRRMLKQVLQTMAE